MSAKKTLTESELAEVLRDNPGWRLEAGELVREWTFANFIEAMEFVKQVGVLAETANHHPDIDIRYNRVTLALISHDAGGITGRDSAMVERLNAIF
jgi:4a-hydroxytetrahydrobiopterin dehydratase